MDASALILLLVKPDKGHKDRARWETAMSHLRYFEQENSRLSVSAIALAELGRHSEELVALLGSHAIAVVGFDDEAARIAAKLHNETLAARKQQSPATRKENRVCVKFDALIYASAIAEQCSAIATSNSGDFERYRDAALRLGLKPAPRVICVDEPRAGQRSLFDLTQY